MDAAINSRLSKPNFTIGLQTLHKREASGTLFSVMVIALRNCTRLDVEGESGAPRKEIQGPPQSV
jgi:hypothetical protein